MENKKVQKCSRNSKMDKNKCPKIEKGEYFLENPLKNSRSEHFGLGHRKNNAKFVTINFFNFLENRFRNFFCYHINGKK